MSHRLTTPAVTFPVTLTELRKQLNIFIEDDDDYLNDLIERATRWCENYCKRAFTEQTWTLSMDSFLDIRYVSDSIIHVPRPPLIAITSISYVDTSGNVQLWDASNYRVDQNGSPGRISLASGQDYPSTDTVTNAVTIVHTAGFGTPSDVPPDIKHGILFLGSYWFDHRNMMANIPGAATPDYTVESLLDPYRVETYS